MDNGAHVCNCVCHRHYAEISGKAVLVTMLLGPRWIKSSLPMLLD